MQVINDTAFLEEAAKTFHRELDEAMADAKNHLEVTVKALDKLWELFAEPGGDTGFFVRCPEDAGPHFDVFDGMEYLEWNKILFQDDRDTSQLSFFSVEEAQRYFLIILGNQVNPNVPHDIEQAKIHVKRQIFSMFNGMNQLHTKFDLLYVDYNMFDGEYAESTDISELLLV